MKSFLFPSITTTLLLLSSPAFALDGQSAVSTAGVPGAQQPKTKGYNVLFIAIDDLNDWVGCLGGNRQAITPNLDRYAREHGMVMDKAYCPSTVCCPTRSALLTGKRASNTGVYGNGNNLKNAPKARDLETLPEYFGRHGYYTLSTGKIFHKHADNNAPAGVDQGQWAFQEHVDTNGKGDGMAWVEKPEVEGIKAGGTDFAWGACNAPVEKTKDYAACKWAADQLQRDFDGKPFFLALGVSKPHLPWYVPQQFFDLYPLDKINQVPIVPDDLDDIVRADGKPIFKPGSRFLLAEKTGMHKNAQRGYLACISYADYCLGVVFDALEKSKYADNTIVMIWGDHGWYLSEKMHYGKTQLWERSARVPFIVNVPGVTPPDFKCEGVVNLIDMYPTLIELCGLPPNKKNDGRSFAPLLANPSKKWNEPTLTTYQFKNHSLTDGRYRYTWYGGRAGGAEELYDHSTDPLEQSNIASNPEYKDVIARLKKYLPEYNEPESPKNTESKKRAPPKNDDESASSLCVAMGFVLDLDCGVEMKKTVWVGLLVVALVGAEAVAMDEARQGYGISSWAGWKPGQISRAECPELRSVPLILKWNQLEPEPGKYAFDEFLGEPLKAAHDDDLYVTLMIWVGPTCPAWIYEKGVPLVLTDRTVNALGQKTDGQKKYPYYLHPEYKNRFMGLIDAFGAYVNDLSPELRKRIVFVQSAEGSTGDGQPYKGNPLEENDEISKAAWNAFRLETWKRYRKALPGIPILVNSDANGGLETEWMVENMDVIAVKNGMFSHGYHVSDNVERLSTFQALEAEAKNRGKPVLSRGEMDGELFEMGWSKQNIPRAVYWSGLFATHCRLDIWNVPYKALRDEANLPALRFFNQYAGHTDPATAPAAFCALRDGLDASDFKRFPADEFGGKPGKKKDVERYIRIAEAYSQQGARMDDPEKATGGGMLNRKRDGSNDVGWGIWPGNYYRFLTQIDPGSGDVGLWNIDDSINGRFARSFDHASDKTQMRFRLDEGFNAKSVKVNVTYLDKGTGSWSIGLPGKSGRTLVRNTDSGEWKTRTVALTNVAELVLKHEAGEDTVFHMIEVERGE